MVAKLVSIRHTISRSLIMVATKNKQTQLTYLSHQMGESSSFFFWFLCGILRFDSNFDITFCISVNTLHRSHVFALFDYVPYWLT